MYSIRAICRPSGDKVQSATCSLELKGSAAHAVRYVNADTPEDPNRRPNYVLIVPTINRQLLDLPFSLVYMLDDFEARSLAYQRAGWREATEDYHKFKSQFSKNPDWKQFFIGVKSGLDYMILQLCISLAECNKPTLMPYWKHPFDLAEEQTHSRPFLCYLEKWLYGDTSAQAYLSFGGLIMIAPFLIADIVGGQHEALIKDRIIHQYRATSAPGSVKRLRNLALILAMFGL